MKYYKRFFETKKTKCENFSLDRTTALGRIMVVRGVRK